MKIKIISDGTTTGTQAVNADTGEPIGGITSIEWSLTAGGIAVATINLIGVPAELVGRANPQRGAS